MDEKQERNLAMFCHLIALSGFIVPLGNFIGPLVLWLVKKDESALVNQEGKKALNFQLSVLLYALVSFVLVLIGIGIIILAALGIFSLVMVIIATVKTSNGEDFKYPLSITFLK